MIISVIQPVIYWEDKSRNFQNLSELLKPLYNKTDIVILPEMFNTGFSMNPARLSEPMYGETCSWMKSMSEKGSFGICGSYMVKESGNFYNRWVFVSNEKEIMYYDKRHLFSMGGEKEHFTPGKSRLIFSFRGTKISPYICYDLRFPVWSRNTEKSDLIIYASNWPDARQNVWNTLLKARAIENQCYVAGSNPTGTDGMGISYSGESIIINPRGEILASAGNNHNTSVTSEISLKELNDFRKKFSVLDDADDFTINL
jgi:predicted amidohydrolase